MSETKLDKILEAIENAGFVPQSYSGRGMYGAQCLSFTCGNAFDSVMLVVAEFATARGCTADDVAQLATDLRGMRTDSMGHDTVVYWPSISWDETLASEMGVGSSRDEEDDEDDDEAEVEPAYVLTPDDIAAIVRAHAAGLDAEHIARSPRFIGNVTAAGVQHVLDNGPKLDELPSRS